MLHNKPNVYFTTLFLLEFLPPPPTHKTLFLLHFEEKWLYGNGYNNFPQIKAFRERKGVGEKALICAVELVSAARRS
jgi:hypothetical protein